MPLVGHAACGRCGDRVEVIRNASQDDDGGRAGVQRLRFHCIRDEDEDIR